MSPEPWTLIVNSDDGTPKDPALFNADHPEMTEDVVAQIFRQMYGMVWWMANKAGENDRTTALAAIKNARENSRKGGLIGKGEWVPGPVNPVDTRLIERGRFDESFGIRDVGDIPVDDEPASPEHPIYKKVKADVRSNFWMITCDEGWRTLIVCTDLYENVADWLLGILGRIPYAKKVIR